MEFNVRNAVSGDIPRLVEIEAEAFSGGWTEASFGLCLSDGKDLLVLESSDGICGFAVLDRTLGDEAELLNIAILSEMRGKGLSLLLMDKILESATAHGIGRIMLEVRVSNAAAIALYNRYGFTKVGLRPGYYKNPTEDAFLMDLLL